jgi:hypothetical protein
MIALLFESIHKMAAVNEAQNGKESPRGALPCSVRIVLSSKSSLAIRSQTAKFGAQTSLIRCSFPIIPIGIIGQSLIGITGQSLPQTRSANQMLSALTASH